MAQVKFDHQYDFYTTGGVLQGFQPVGCALMTLATLLLVDHCGRAGTPRELGAARATPRHAAPHDAM